MNSTKILLKGGTLLIHAQDSHVVPTVADLLISDSFIIKIAQSIPIEQSEKVEVIDCTDKIISPGFIDTHHHLWQTQLKGQHADQTLLEYFPCGNFTSAFYTPEDMFWGQLSGAMEALDAGTTTVVDHASCNVTAEHTHEALRATVTSGLRTIFCYTPLVRATGWTPFVADTANVLAPWVMSTFEYLASKAPFGPNGRVKLGFAFDGLYNPPEVIKRVYNTVRNAGAHLITNHGIGGPIFGSAHSTLTKLADLGLLSNDILVSHANYPAPNEAALLASSGAHISTTPSTELQMGHGPLLALHPDFIDHGSLGIDCHSNNSASIPAQMNLLLQSERAKYVAALAEHGAPRTSATGRDEFVNSGKGKWARSLPAGLTVEAVFNLGTVGGAAAAGLAGEVGRLADGMRADIVVFDARSPGMLAAARQDPVGAVVQHGSVRDVEMVFVDGVVRKAGGVLRDVVVAGGDGEAGAQPKEGVQLGWREVAERVLESRDRIVAAMQGVDFKEAEDAILKMFYMNKAGMV